MWVLTSVTQCDTDGDPVAPQDGHIPSELTMAFAMAGMGRLTKHLTSENPGRFLGFYSYERSRILEAGRCW